MRIIYQSGELKLSLTKQEIDHVVENTGTPVTMDIKMLKVLHEDISKAVLNHWSNVEVWEALESHQKYVNSKTKTRK